MILEEYPNFSVSILLIMKIALASPPFPKSISEGLCRLEEMVKDAANEKAAIICFPESYLPGYPGMGYKPEQCSAESLQAALDKVSVIARENEIAIIIPMDWHRDGKLFNVAQVISASGEGLGYQTKNQLDPTEDEMWTPGTTRRIFEVKGVKFGITICHEGFRYPESVRWAARQEAKIVFHPHFAGSDTEGPQLTEWGNKSNPYYEKAMMMRALENTIFFASSNYASRYPDSASSIIGPDGTCIKHETYGRAGIIVSDLDLTRATGLLAKRFKPIPSSDF